MVRTINALSDVPLTSSLGVKGKLLSLPPSIEYEATFDVPGNSIEYRETDVPLMILNDRFYTENLHDYSPLNENLQLLPVVLV